MVMKQLVIFTQGKRTEEQKGTVPDLGECKKLTQN